MGQEIVGQEALSKEPKGSQNLSPPPPLCPGVQNPRLPRVSSGGPLALNTQWIRALPCVSTSARPCRLQDVHIHTLGSLRAMISAVPSAWSALPQSVQALPHPTPASSSLPQLECHSYIPTSQGNQGLSVPGTTLWLMNLALCCGPGLTEGSRASWHPVWPVVIL